MQALSAACLCASALELPALKIWMPVFLLVSAVWREDLERKATNVKENSYFRKFIFACVKSEAMYNDL